MNYYETLGVNQNDSIDTIKEAYRNKAKENHPDKQISDEWKKYATEYMITLNCAYEILSDPIKRMEYDQLLQPDVDQERYPYTEPSNSNTEVQQPISRGWIAKVLIFLLIFGGGNLILYLVQGNMHSDEKKQMAQIENQLQGQELDLDNLENQLKTLDDNISQLDAEMAVWEISDIDQYNDNVDRYNALLLEYNSLCGSYEQQIDIYNAKVEEYNKLSEKVGEEFYIIPIPIHNAK